MSLTARVLKTMSVFGGVQMLTLLCSVVRMKFVAIWLGPAGVGLFAIFNSSLDMMVAGSQLGLRNSAVRDIAAAPRGSKQERLLIAIVRRWGRWLGWLGLVVALVAAPLLSLNSFGELGHTWQFASLGLLLFLLAMIAADQVVLQATQHLKALARSTLWGVVGGVTVSIPLFYFFRLDSIVPAILANGLMCFLAARYWSHKEVPTLVPTVTPRETWQLGRRFIVMGIYMTMAEFVTQLMSYIFISYLNMVGDSGQVGFYQAGYTIVNRYVGMVLVAVVMEFYPRLAAAVRSSRRVRVFMAHEIMLVLLVLTPAATVFVAVAPWIVELLYASEFEVIVPFITIAMTGVVMRGASWCMAYLILSRGDGPVYLLTEGLSCIAALGLNILGYQQWGITGLGVSYVVWYLLYTMIVVAIYFGLYHQRLPWRVVALFGGCLAMVAAASMIALQWGALMATPLAAAACAASLLLLVRLGLR